MSKFFSFEELNGDTKLTLEFKKKKILSFLVFTFQNFTLNAFSLRSVEEILIEKLSTKKEQSIRKGQDKTLWVLIFDINLEKFEDTVH